MTDLPPLAFLDTETTGLDLDDHVWDFAAIIREPGKPDMEWQTFVEHDVDRAARLPEPFLADYCVRYDPARSITPLALAGDMLVMLHRCLIVGAVPSFDTTRLELLMRRNGVNVPPPWHYQVVDVETLTLGYLSGLITGVDGGPWIDNSDVRAKVDRLGGVGWDIPMPPWNSHTLTSLVGVSDVPGVHTAIGDARWARDTFDAVNPWPAYTRVT